MKVHLNDLWALFREIRIYCRLTGLRVSSQDNPVTRTFGFVTVCSEFDSRDREWVIPLTQVIRCSKRFDLDLEGEPVQHEAQRELLWCYLDRMRSPIGRQQIAEALSTGQHPAS